MIRRTVTAVVAAVALMLAAAPAAARPTPVPKTPRTPGPVTTATLYPTSPGTRVAADYAITPGIDSQGLSITLPPGKVPLAMGYHWGPASLTENPYAPTPGGPDNVGGGEQPYGIRFRATNARLILLNSRDGYVWRAYLTVDADADAAAGQAITLWVLYN